MKEPAGNGRRWGGECRALWPLIQCGQHSLEIFCLGVTLAFAGHVAVVGTPDNAVVRVLVSVAGIAAMIGLSALMTWYNSTRVSFRIVAQAADEKAIVADPPEVAARAH